MLNEQPFSCTRDGLVIRGHVYGLTDIAKPAVILSHGFMGRGFDGRAYAMMLSEMGFVAFTYDFCGGSSYSVSDGKTADMTVETERQDLLAVADYISTLPGVNPDDITLMGFSQGGFVSTLAGAKNPERFKRLILMFPALCIPDDARRGHMLSYQFDPLNIPELLGTVPMELGAAYARVASAIDIFALIKGYSGKVLLVHGTADAVVPISYAERASETFPNCTYCVIQNGGHGFTGSGDIKACDAIRAFLS